MDNEVEQLIASFARPKRRKKPNKRQRQRRRERRNDPAEHIARLMKKPRMFWDDNYGAGDGLDAECEPTPEEFQ